MGIFGSLFGPSKEEVWTAFAQAARGRYVSGGWLGRDVVRVPIGARGELTLDTYAVSTGKTTVIYTRVRVPYVNPSAFRFKVYRASVFTPVGHFFGMQDVEVGDRDFDRDFVVQSGDERTVRLLLQDEGLRRLFMEQPQICVESCDDEGWFGTRFPDGVDELRFVCTGVIRDEARLRALYDLFSAALERLVQLKLARDEETGVVLK